MNDHSPLALEIRPDDLTGTEIRALVAEPPESVHALGLEALRAPAFAPALGLYERDGFRRCGPFGDDQLDPFSIFMTRPL